MISSPVNPSCQIRWILLFCFNLSLAFKIRMTWNSCHLGAPFLSWYQGYYRSSHWTRAPCFTSWSLVSPGLQPAQGLCQYCWFSDSHHGQGGAGWGVAASAHGRLGNRSCGEGTKLNCWLQGLSLVLKPKLTWNTFSPFTPQKGPNSLLLLPLRPFLCSLFCWMVSLLVLSSLVCSSGVYPPSLLLLYTHVFILSHRFHYDLYLDDSQTSP